MPTKLTFQISVTVRKNRLDEFLFEEIKAVSKMYLLELLKKGECKINNKSEKGGYHLQAGDFVEIEIDLDADTAMKPEAIPLEIVFEDSEIIVIDKPPGMLVHPTLGQKSGTLLNGLAYHLNSHYLTVGKDKIIHPSSFILQPFTRPGLVHRLDRQTSGLMIIAKTSRAHRILCDHFQRKLIEKRYLAIVECIVEKDSGAVYAPIGHFADEKRWGVKADGKTAETRFRVLQRFTGKTLLELEPVTGRTNQLRIHCASIGHPIIGDKLYGGREFSRLCLHAAKLTFWHPNGDKRLEFESDLPKEFDEI
ncbi:MAG: RluA family pseudouridine synthase [Acidobacteriota bacterium]|nr:RluA family pseudouridine synthase [Acidobacteriota bacterium]